MSSEHGASTGQVFEQCYLWSKTAKPPFDAINARADKLLTSGSWREPFQRRRCLIPGEFFYEWEPIDRKTKQPYAVALTDDRLRTS
jgi:putative SOS response-associated peptidase YedK